jgi:hypothetical protein
MWFAERSPELSVALECKLRFAVQYVPWRAREQCRPLGLELMKPWRDFVEIAMRE